MSLKKQIIILVSIVLAFALLDIGIYEGLTKRYFNSTNKEMQAKSIEVSKYLPFENNSEIVKFDSKNKLTGDLPTVDGAAALYPVFSAFVNAVYPKESVEFDGENFTSKSRLHYTNTRGAYKAVVDGEADIIFCAKPSEEQKQYAKDNNVELEYVPIGREAFVFIVNANNPVDNLTVEQVRGIYSGKYQKWSEFGGEDCYIEPLQRNEGSGSQTSMLAFMNGEEMKYSVLGFTAGKPIGLSFRYYVEGLVANGKIKMLSLNGVYPDKENIANGKYPVASNFFAVYDKNNPNPNIKKFMEWILSDEGQEIIEKSGYVPLES